MGSSAAKRRQGTWHDETSLQGELYTIVHNKDAHGRKGAIIAAVKGTNPADVLRVLMQLPADKREMVESINLEGLAAQRKAYRERMMAKHGRKWKKSKRGKKPKRLNTRFEPPRLTNGETLVEALTRCRRQLSMSLEKWSLTQEKRAKILFELHPKLDKVAACTLREIKSVRDTIKFYEDEILNYFIERQTNASAESLNSKIKCFWAQVKGIRDIPFFMYRLATVLG